MSSNVKITVAPAHSSGFVPTAGNESGFAASFESSPDATLIVDPGAAKIAYANAAAATLFGLSRAEITGSSVGTLQTRAENLPLFEAVQKLVRVRGSSTLPEFRLESGSEEKWIEPAGHVFEVGDRTFVLCTLRDVTVRHIDRERTETRRRFEALQRLAGGLSHDFNNMLTCVRGYSSIVLETPGLPEDVREMVTLIDGAGVRATALSRRFLEFSRPENFEPTPTSVATFLQEALNALDKIAAPDARVQLVPVDQRLFALIDERLLLKALGALVQNARDALVAPGEIQLSARAATRPSLSDVESPRAATATQPVVEIAVTDRGRGMPAIVLAQLFEPGFTMKKSAGAPGMGLPTAYRIAREHGGDVEVTSRDGVGTSVLIVLPRLMKASSSAEPV